LPGDEVFAHYKQPATRVAFAPAAGFPAKLAMTASKRPPHPRGRAVRNVALVLAATLFALIHAPALRAEDPKDLPKPDQESTGRAETPNARQLFGAIVKVQTRAVPGA